MIFSLAADIKNLKSLWADGDVMRFVGFPDGLQETVWADPDPENVKAIALYERSGFRQKEMPPHVIALGEDQTAYLYYELRRS